MKRTMLFAFLSLTLVSGVAGAADVGIGAYGGVGVPIVQDDNGRGNVFGVRVPVSLLPLLTVEPYYASNKGGDKDQVIGGTTITRSGIDVTGFGANALLTFGGTLKFYPFAGIGSHKLKRTGTEETRTTFNFGLGLGICPPVAKLTIHLRGELNAAVKDEASRKWGTITAGVSYNLVKFPPTP